jgi:AcrR family transcriptional regulator
MSGNERSAKVAKKSHRRVERTHQVLRAALLRLIQEKGFEALSVQEIVTRANVGRATFYSHFGNKEDLLVSGFEDLRAALNKRQRESLAHKGRAEERLFAFSHEVFAHVNEYRNVFRAMVGKKSGPAVQQLMHKILLDLVRDDVKAAVSRGDRSSIPVEALARFVAGGHIGLLTWWLTVKTQLSVDEVDEIFRRFAIPAVIA